MKVFCEDCKYFDVEYPKLHNPGKCEFPTNRVVDRLPDTWRAPGKAVIRNVLHPSEINILNQCIMYEENK